MCPSRKHYRIGFGAILALTALSAAPRAEAQSEQVASAVSNLTRRYEESIVVVNADDPTTGGDLQVACLSLVFQNWSKAYLGVLERTEIEPQAAGAPLMAFGKMWFSAEDELKVAEYFRPGVTRVLSQVIEEIRAASGGQPAPLDPTKITLADVQDPIYFANLNICLDQNIIDKSLPQLRPVDPSAPLPPGLRRSRHGSVSWVKTLTNGIKPVWTEPSALEMSASSIGGETPMTYGQYLREFSNQ